MSKEKKTMIRIKSTATLILALAAVGLFSSAAASANDGVFGITPETLDQRFENQDGTENLQAGAHPFAVTNEFKFDSVVDPSEPPTLITAGQSPRTVYAEEFPGVIGDPFAGPQCAQDEFFSTDRGIIHCFDEAQVGLAEVTVKGPFGGNETLKSALYNLTPSAGVPAEFGFWAFIVPVKLTAEVRSDGDYGITVKGDNLDETLNVIAVRITFWGVPGDPAHDSERAGFFNGQTPIICSSAGANPPCTYHGPVKAFLTTPVDCAHGPMATNLFAESWNGESDTDSVLSHDDAGDPAGMSGCDRVPFEPTIDAQPSTSSAESPTGLKAVLEIPDDGIHAPKGLTQSTLKKAIVKLPEGVTLNPSAGEGLGYCTPADYVRETLDAEPGEGCPNSSKLGSIRIDTPVLDLPAEGSLYIAQTDDRSTTTPGAENPFDSLLAMYVVARVPERGVIVRAEAKVVPDPKTGQLVTTFDDLPPLPFSKFTLAFREGARAPLATPRTCGTYTTVSELTPWSATSPKDVFVIETPFKVEKGVDGGPCPDKGTAPWHPGLRAGTLNNSAGSYSPFNVRLTRNDGEQEFTNFSIKLPPGVIGKLAGIPFCPDAAVAVARGKSGAAELASPSCPAASEVGRTLVGAGVGPVVTYVPGKVYLAGPYNGSALSIIAITAAKVGPFDLGTVVIRQALKINPETAEVFIDPTGSDPIPHIIDGVVVHARDIRVYVDRPEFTLNPTNCQRTSTASTVVGSGLDFVNDADNNPLTVTSPFQAADCASLRFKPKLALSVSASARRANPAFKAVLRMNPGEANISRAQVTLPRTEFLDNSHIGTVCTRVQFRAERSARRSRSTAARVPTRRFWTPRSKGPSTCGRTPNTSCPIWCRPCKSDKIEVDLVGRVDSVGKGRIRTTFEGVPDAPVSKFVLEMLGGDKGLLLNTANLCAGKQRAIVRFVGQNGKRHNFNPRAVATTSATSVDRCSEPVSGCRMQARSVSRPPKTVPVTKARPRA